MALKPTDVQNFIECLDAGTLEPRLAALLSDVASAVIAHGDKKKGGEVNLKLKLKRFGNENSPQVDVAGVLEFVRPTSRGKQTENLGFISRFYVNERGNMTDFPESQTDAFNKPHQSTRNGDKTNA